MDQACGVGRKKLRTRTEVKRESATFPNSFKLSPELAEIVALWAALPVAIQAAILPLRSVRVRRETRRQTVSQKTFRAWLFGAPLGSSGHALFRALQVPDLCCRRAGSFAYFQGGIAHLSTFSTAFGRRP